MKLVSKVTLDGVELNGVWFTYGVRLEDYISVLGEPTRSEPIGPPAPYGHRNPIIHFYDHLGLFLHEHHATYLVQGISFLFDPLTSSFPTSSPYSGELWVREVRVRAGMKFKEFAQECEATFKSSLGGYWHLENKAITIGIQLFAPSRKRGSPKTAISRVGITFMGAHRLSVVT